MTTEDFQTLVLQQLQGLQQNIANLDSRIGNLDARIDNLDSQMVNLDAQMDNLASQMVNLDARMDNLGSQVTKMDFQMDKLGFRVDDLETKLAQRMDAQYSIINAKVEECITIQQNDLMRLLELIHEEMATQEEVDRIVKTQAEQSKMLSLLSTRSIKQEAELEYLKLAK